MNLRNFLGELKRRRFGLTPAHAAAPHSALNEFEYTPPIGRRALILGALGVLVAGGGAQILRKLYRAASFGYDGLQYKGETVQAITPNEQFYCVTKMSSTRL